MAQTTKHAGLGLTDDTVTLHSEVHEFESPHGQSLPLLDSPQWSWPLLKILPIGCTAKYGV